MQTRAAAARAAAEALATAQAAAQAAAPPPPPPINAPANPPVSAQLSFGSSLSTLTPTSSFGSFSSDCSIATTKPDDSQYPAVSALLPLSPSHFGRMQTPIQSQSRRYPSGVLDTPKKVCTNKPTYAECQAARLARDEELARSGGHAQLTRTGTILVAIDESSPSEFVQGQGLGIGLGSAFSTPSVSQTPQVKKPPLEVEETWTIDPSTGQWVKPGGGK
ncbi:hypothetical protein B0H10DRAFT_1980624 [Mycena sp. CBHHK59/15]|nr:hypothetical protein B0H10DRAFT_1980624 [Mycena sp. CBHHK59/15]